MKTTMLTLLLLSITVLPVLGAPSDSIPRRIDAAGFNNLSTALASPSTAGKAVVISNPMTINDKTTDRDIIIVSGGKIIVAAGKSLSINGLFSAGPFQVFDGSGSVIFGTGNETAIHPEWWGAKGDGISNDGVAIAKAAVAASGRKLMLTKTYALAKECLISNPVTITGGGTVLQKTAGSTAFRVTSDHVNFNDLTITGNTVAGASDRPFGSEVGILFEASKSAPRSNGTVNNCTISRFAVGVKGLWNHGLVVNNCTIHTVAAGVYGGVSGNPAAEQNNSGKQSYTITNCRITCSFGSLEYSRPVILPGCAGYCRIEGNILRGGGMSVETVLNSATLSLIPRYFLLANDADTAFSVASHAKIIGNVLDLDNAPAGRGRQPNFYQAIECGVYSIIQGNTVRKYPNAVATLQPHQVIDSNRFISCGHGSVGNGAVVGLFNDFLTADTDMNVQITNNTFTDTGANVSEISLQWGASHSHTAKGIIISNNISSNAGSFFLLAHGLADSQVTGNIIKNCQSLYNGGNAFGLWEAGNSASVRYDNNTFINTLTGGYGMTTAMALGSKAVVGFHNFQGMREGYGFYNNTISFIYTTPVYLYNNAPVTMTRSISGPPAGVLIPLFIGEEVRDVLTGSWWKSISTAKTGWGKVTK